MDLRPSRTLLVLAAVLASTGCAFTMPSLAFKNAKATEVDFEGATLQLTFALKNPNPIGFNLDSIKYQLDVEGHHVVSGQPPNGVAVASQGTTDLVFPARFKFLEIAPVVETFLNKDKANYKASGAVGINTPIGPIELPLSYSGSFQIPKMPAITFREPRMGSLSIQGARIVFPVQIQNKNGFALPMGGITASFNIGGANVGTVQAVTPRELAAGKAEVIEIPLDINFLQAGFAVAQAIQSRSAQVQLTGELKSGSASIPIKLSERLNFK